MAVPKELSNMLKEVLAEVRPDEKKVMKEVDATLKRINSCLKKSNLKAKAATGGSIAKGTFLKGDYDCDIFVRFNLRKYKSKDSEISDMLEKCLKKIFRKVERVHGSRDYFHVENSFMYEIVPVLDIKKTSEAVNVTDCSPLHVDWVRKFPKMNDEIRLAKAFMKAAGVYGAESYIKGFSGHVVDILTIYYGGFISLLKASKAWKAKDVIDYHNYHRGKAMFNLNSSKTESALIVIDPIQPNRNAAAALSEEKFYLFKKKAEMFLADPSKKFFVKEKLNIESLKKKAEEKKGKLIIMDVGAKKGKEDIIGAKLLKSLEYIVTQMKMNDFNIIDSGWDWDESKKAIFWIITDKEDLPERKIWPGPPVKIKAHYDKFIKSHKGSFEKNGRVYAEVKREHVNAEKFIKNIIKDDYITEKVKSISIR